MAALSRRSLLGAGLAAWLSKPGAAECAPSADLEPAVLEIGGAEKIAKKCLVLIPRHARPNDRLPLLVLLHGLGETGNEALGLSAWSERYGLVRAYERLRRPPIAPTLRNARYLTSEHARALNASLKKVPFGGAVLACPVTPNPWRLPPTSRTLDLYADWLADAVIPAVRKQTRLLAPRGPVGLAGCSLGGYVGVEVMLRRPQSFATFGGVQAAWSVPNALDYARRLESLIATHGARPLHFLTSAGDPYRSANQAMAKELERLGLDHDLEVLPGPHDQPWLREIGSIAMLRWHERALVKAAGI